MSTEKLSELSNNARKAANSFFHWSQMADCTSERVSCLTVEQLKDTSELLSALLAELEAKDEQNKLLMREIEHGKKLRVNMQNNADSLSERIAELEAEITNVVDSHAETVAELRAKLATPVRLPDVRFIKVGETAVAVMHDATSVKEQIQRAGFKVERDE